MGDVRLELEEDFGPGDCGLEHDDPAAKGQPNHARLAWIAAAAMTAAALVLGWILVVKIPEASKPREVQIVLNWFTELERLAGPGGAR